MDLDEKIRAHIVSVWREKDKKISLGGREGMLILTDRHLMFVQKTEAKFKWWQAVVQRQTLNFIKSGSKSNIMIRHDGYDEESLKDDLEIKKNVEIPFENILDVNYVEKDWGSVLNVEYHLNGKHEKFRFSIAQDWVKYPLKEPTKYIRIDWRPLVQFIKDRQKITR